MSPSSRPSVVLPDALKIPIMQKLQHRRVVLASASPRRKEELARAGLAPEIVVSRFDENLPKHEFQGRLSEYPISTAGEKAMEVYERMVREDPDDAPDLVISADTVVIFPPEEDTAEGGEAHGEESEILEKPMSKDEQRRWLNMMNGRRVQIVTAVTLAYPSVVAPGYKLESISCSTIANFADNNKDLIEAYVESGDGLEKAGGFGIQSTGGLLIERIEGDYDNVKGFPTAPFWRWMVDLDSGGVFDEARDE
ncbi:inosine triphosphate pyrophosphatase-like protein [Kockovaella imperatae]|uniref:Inosine triphosphate pyrophosphatase-like protein n=1 Tax=Kockovaella imperatae TaxID=4999 RepID=A0A1Y1UEG4_9TREE|nr:inosine triphosphate pyrophosphatase-like protein [Kockovaella imperatae]ORX36412.1 inosine triphosphate pyrophosphatase-like protein [Kockovaella imperatae]